MSNNGLATEKQVRYVLYLLGRAGYETKHMSGLHKILGVPTRSGSVAEWLRARPSREIGELIASLKKSIKD